MAARQIDNPQILPLARLNTWDISACYGTLRLR